MIEQALSGIRSRNILDDIIIGATSVKGLLKTLEVLEQLFQKKLSLNRAKCDFIKGEITYMGHCFEQIYSQIERECLAILIAVQRFTFMV